MSKQKKFLKAVMGLCLAVVILLGTGIQAKAATPVEVTWEEGKIIDIGPGEAVKINDPGDGYYLLLDGSLFLAGNGYTFSEDGIVSSGGKTVESANIKWVECKKYDWPEYDVYGELAVYCYTTPRPVQTVSTSSSCSHTFDWNTEREATAKEDGLASWKCTKCGQVDSWMTTTAYHVFNKEAGDAIAKADANATVTISTRTWESFHKSVIDKLAARPDVTLILNYTYQHKDYTVTIPAGSDLSKLVDENGFCGFRYLDSIYLGSEIVK